MKLFKDLDKQYKNQDSNFFSLKYAKRLKLSWWEMFISLFLNNRVLKTQQNKNSMNLFGQKRVEQA